MAESGMQKQYNVRNSCGIFSAKNKATLYRVDQGSHIMPDMRRLDLKERQEFMIQTCVCHMRSRETIVNGRHAKTTYLHLDERELDRTNNSVTYISTRTVIA